MEDTTMLKRLAVVALMSLAFPASAAKVKYYHLDALGSVRVVTDSAGNVVERHDYLPFGEECTTGGCAANPGLGAGEPRKFTGKERDKETGLDYFGARYMAAPTGRFTTVDPVYTWRENLLDPQRWNRYTYVRNNPLKFVDPDGRVLDTIWDVGNIIYDVYSGLKTGNWTDLGADIVAAAIPFVPAGASKLRHLNKLEKVADAAADTKTLIKGGETAATKAGREAHKEFAEKVRAKADDGWRSEPNIKGPNGENLRPDALSPSGRPVELKPNTPSGHRRGERQLKKYEDATGKKGKVVYYEPKK